MKIAVAGTGYVGLVTAVCLADVGHQVTCVDIDEKKIRLMQAGKSPIFEIGLEDLMIKNQDKLAYTTDFEKAYSEADVIIIGVGTPELPDGTADLSYVWTVTAQIASSIRKDCVVVVKSTVPIGTNEKIEQTLCEMVNSQINVYVVSNPEFLSQGTAVRDTLFAKRIVVGTENLEAKKIMETLYQNLDIPKVWVNRRTAEMIKYASNDFLALKISYINEIANICSLVGADIDGVRLGMGLDNRIGDKFLNPGIGYGGACFPKDTKALYTFVKDEYGYEALSLKATIEINNRQKTILFDLAKRDLGSLKSRKISFLGLTYKPGTDDLREAPSLYMFKKCLDEGCIISAFDPVGITNAKKWLNGPINYVSSTLEALKVSEVIFILTEWKEIIETDPRGFDGKFVYDGRNCLSNEQIGHCQKYVSIGRLIRELV